MDFWRPKNVRDWVSVFVSRGVESRAPHQNAASRIVKKLVAAALDDIAFLDGAPRADCQIGNDRAFPPVSSRPEWIIVRMEHGKRNGRGVRYRQRILSQGNLG